MQALTLQNKKGIIFIFQFHLINSIALIQAYYLCMLQNMFYVLLNLLKITPLYHLPSSFNIIVIFFIPNIHNPVFQHRFTEQYKLLLFQSKQKPIFSFLPVPPKHSHNQALQYHRFWYLLKVTIVVFQKLMRIHWLSGLLTPI